jgi:hypothetical protein
VKIAGLGIAAALAGPALTAQDEGAETGELTDTRDLARLLYAALTGYWPGQPGSAGAVPGPPPQAARPALLPPAPENGAGLCTPRQVSAAVPTGIDDVTCRALFQRPNRHGPALSTAAMFAEALASAAPPMPFPLSPAAVAAARTPPRGYGYPDGATSPYPPPEATPRPRPGGGRKPPAERSAAIRALVSVVILLVLAAIGIAAWSISNSMHRSAAPAPSGSHSPTPTTAAAIPLRPVGASVFNPLGSSDDDDPADAQNAIDGSTSTAWHTSYYLSHLFGNLKKGTGLIIDMGRPVRLSQVAVQFGPTCCTHVDIELGNRNTATQAALSTFTAVKSSTTAQGSTTFDVTSRATGRYLLIWITDLPPLAGSPGKFETLIYDVTVHGFAAGQPG